MSNLKSLAASLLTALLVLPTGLVQAANPSHFTPSWTGQPYNRMNLWVTKATLNGEDLTAGDEIGIFDGKQCVGVGRVTAPLSQQNYLTITASQDDGSGQGFRVGQEISLKIWDQSSQTEIASSALTLTYLNNLSPPPFTGNADYLVELSATQAINTPPSLTITEPDGTGDTADTSYTISWQDADPEENATLALYYDTDNSGADGTLIVEKLQEDSATDTHTWDTAAIPAGDYYIYGVIKDGVNAAVTAYSSGKVQVNHAPVAENQSRKTAEDTALELTLSAQDPDEDTLSYTILQDPTQGNLSGSAPNLTYTPNANYQGTDTFTYKVNDGTVDSNTATVTISVTPLNDAPTLTITEPDGTDDSADQTYTISWQDADPDSDAKISLYYDTNNTGKDGTLIVENLSEDAEKDTYKWATTEIPAGTYYIYGVINDGENAAVTAYSKGVVTIEAAPHFTPSWTGQPYNRMNLWVTKATLNGEDLTAGDEIGIFDGKQCVGVGRVTAPLSQQNYLTITASQDDGSGQGFRVGQEISLKIWDQSSQTEIASSALTLTYLNNLSPPPFTGNADYLVELSATQAISTPPSLTITEPDGTGDSADQTYTISWQDADPDSDAKISLYYDTNNTGKDGTLIVENLSEDAEKDTYKWATTAVPAGDYYIYGVIKDGVNPAVTAYSSGKVQVNHAPVAENQSRKTAEDTALELTLSAQDPDEDTLSYTILQDPTQGNLSGSAPNLTYTPNANYQGTDTFTYKVNDGIVDSNTATVTISVTPVNDAPTLTITEPNGTDDSADQTYTISWQDADPEENATLALYYDTDNSGADGTLIVEKLQEDSATDTHTWDTAAIPAGDYYIYGVIKDGVNAAVTAYSKGVVTIEATPHFTPKWTGNPYNRMNLWVTKATLKGEDLVPGDEIGIFDGKQCVGVGRITAPLSQQNYLKITAAQDDGSGQGFRTGQEITLKIWDESSQTEIASSALPLQYFDLSGSPITTPTFAGNSEYLVALGQLTQTIPLKAGWNMFSTYLIPDKADFLKVVQTLQEEKVLLKVLDEQGRMLVNLLGEWLNEIGELAITEGYEIKTSAATKLQLTGTPTALPLTIPLTAGWNIISYPSSKPQTALEVVQPLIKEGSLVKVLDEEGNTLLKLQEGWVNKIGDLKPGKGYKIKVQRDTTLVITE